MQKMTAINTISVEKGKGEHVTARFAKAKAVHTFEGFIRMEVLLNESLEAHDEIKVCTTWEDRQFFDNWLENRNKTKKQESKDPNPAEPNPILGTELSLFDVKVQRLPAENE